MAEKRGRRQKGDEGPSQLPAPPSHACTTGTNPASLRTFSRAFAGGKQSFPGGTRVQDPLPPSSRGITPCGASRQPPPPLSDHWGEGTSSHMCECSTCTGQLRYLQTDLAGRPGQARDSAFLTSSGEAAVTKAAWTAANCYSRKQGEHTGSTEPGSPALRQPPARELLLSLGGHGHHAPEPLTLESNLRS